MKRSKKWLLVLLCLAFFLFLGITLYPAVSGCLLTHRAGQEAKGFLANIDPPLSEKTYPEEEKLQEQKYPDLWEASASYNLQLQLQKQAGLTDPSAYEQRLFHLQDFGLSSEVFAVISIPDIGLEMPVYLGADPEHLSMGAAQLGQTSLPIGGVNSNCVISGHRGWKGAAYFRDLPELQIGDSVWIINLWESLEYRVKETQLIASSDIEAILIREGEDLLTLLTCEYGSNGRKFRYLVICERA